MILCKRLSSVRAHGVCLGRTAPLRMLLALIVSMAWPGMPWAQSLEEGRAIYERRCSVCHGDKGSGAFWASDSLNPPPRNFTATDAQTLSRDAMIDAVTHGRRGTAMTAWGSRFSSRQIASVVDFIRAELMPSRAKIAANGDSGAAFPGGLKGDAAKGGIFFHANCAECHGHAGDGRGRRADFMAKKPLDFTAPESKSAFNRPRLFESISRGVRGTPMPAWSKVLNGEQIADVSEYVYRAFIDNQGPTEPDTAGRKEIQTSGERIYFQRCSYCHGHKGDGRTAAAQVLDPKPRDFTGVHNLTVADAVAAVRGGRAGTAMPSFAKVLSETEIQAVAEYVTVGLAERKGENGRYHTAANGWPEHDIRYGPAIPFALGYASADAPLSTFSPAERDGLALFKEACISCHFGKRDSRLVTPIRSLGYSPAEYEEGPHDKAPEIADLTPAELEGRRLYQAACGQCHAADGTGKNWIGSFLDPSPPDFRDPKLRTLLSSDAFVERTLRAPNGTSMPSFENILSRDQTTAIAGYVRRAFQTP